MINNKQKYKINQHLDDPLLSTVNPDAGLQNAKKNKLGTFGGVFIPCAVKSYAILFLRISYGVGTLFSSLLFSSLSLSKKHLLMLKRKDTPGCLE